MGNITFAKNPENVMLYSFFIHLYGLVVRLAAVQNPKARLWADGRKGWAKKMMEKLQPNEQRVWFHCPSLGEFEQARPVIEGYRQKHPDKKIILTFYSPSGYEIRKNYPGADYIFYLPEDTCRNARIFLRLVNPTAVFFVKYDFWKNYLTEIHRQNIPLYLFSAIFRPGQAFFKWYGGWYRRLLHCFSHIYVQDQASAQLLQTIGIHQVTVAGDTRFDRVAAIAAAVRDIPQAAQFAGESTVLVAGSTWPADEQLLIQYLRETSRELKIILAPHEIEPSHIRAIETLLGDIPYIKFSEWPAETTINARVLIIDNIGMLSSLYRYGTIAYIGGGFGKGIHNILEAATFGLPIIFGPNYQRFKEAIDLVTLGGAWSVSDYKGFKSATDHLINHPQKLSTASGVASGYVKQCTGATSTILKNC